MTGGQYWCYPPDLHKLMRLIETSDLCPTYDQMQAHLGWQSKSGVWKAITLLERIAYLRRMKQRRQAIESTRPTHLVWNDSLKMLVPMLDDASAVLAKALEAAE